MEISTLKDYLECVKALGARKLRMALEGENRDAEEILTLERALSSAAAEALERGCFLPAEYLFQRFRCDAAERHCVSMALCAELDGSFASGFACMREEGQAAGLTPHIVRLTWPESVSDETLYRVFHSASVLMRLFFQRPPQGFAESGKPLVLARRTLDFMLGVLEEDRGLTPFMTRYIPEDPLPPLNGEQPDLSLFLGEGRTLVELIGEAGAGKRFCVRHYCSAAGRLAYFIRADRRLLTAAAEAGLAEDIRRECLLFQAIPVFLVREGTEREPDRRPWPEEQVHAEELNWLAELLLQEMDTVFLLGVRPLSGGSDGGEMPRRGGSGHVRHLRFEIRDMSLTEKRQVWRREAAQYTVEDGLRPEEMANLYQATYGGIRRVLQNAAWNARSQGRTAVGRQDLQKGCRGLFQVNMEGKAARVPSVYTWEDLILPDHQKRLLSAACDQVRYKHRIYEDWGFSEKIVYGRGVSMIFAGGPGTGKTMAAQVFAGELGIDLYRIELSAVVSKFVGETEKNLNLIFEQAERSRIILFFDEADVLFGKRTEVKDANDKYSNMEAAFLLQKMEEYEGVTILATNLIQNFDEAFKRRVKFVIDFPFPDEADRKKLWLGAMPQKMERDELDFDFLAAGFELSGSNIKNVVLHAAFLAAGDGTPVGMRHILLAVRNEYAKSGKVLTAKDLGEYYVLLPELSS